MIDCRGCGYTPRVADPTPVIRAIAGSRTLTRVAGAYALFILTEYAVWIAMLVYAYQQGGATTAGLIVIAQTVPASLLAPFIATVADRRSPAVLLIGGYVTQAAAMGITAIALLSGISPFAAYAAAVVAATAVAATRPAHAVLVPGLVRSAAQLSAMNVVTGWVESVGIAVAGGMTGALLTIGSAGLVFAVCSGFAIIATLLVASLRTFPLAVDDAGDAPARVLADVVDGIRLLTKERHPQLLVITLALAWVVLGALDVLFVVLAINVLHQGQAWAGYLNMAFGIGGVLAGGITAMLVGRRLGVPILAASLVMSLGVGLTALSGNVLATAALLALAGMGSAVLEMATRALLQRAVPAQLLGRIFGVVEGVTMAGLALGSLLTTLLIHLGGPTLAVAGVAAVLPVGLVLGGRSLLTLDSSANVPIVEIALLRSLPHFAPLPGPALEGLARSLECVRLPAGAVLMREGDAGDRFYAIADGELEVAIAGAHVSTQRRGDGVGEIALLRNVPRTATVTAVSDVTLYALDRTTFLTAVTGHGGTHAAVAGIADGRLTGDEVPGGR
jgi:Cyclic nucleotide-binding domain/Major Facilitator Superfamily